MRRDGGVEYWSLEVDAAAGVLDDPTVTACRRARVDASLRAVVLQDGAHRGTGFAAGASTSKPRATRTYTATQDSADDFAQLLRAIDALPQVVIASIEHGASGGAGGLLCCADVCIAVSDATFMPPHAGFDGELASVAPYLARRVGPGAAQAWILDRRPWTAEQALDAGLVHEVVPAGSLDAAVRQSLEAYRRAGPQAVARAKHLMRRAEHHTRAFGSPRLVRRPVDAGLPPPPMGEAAPSWTPSAKAAVPEVDRRR